MRMITKAVLLAGALVAPCSTALAWNLAPCSSEAMQKRGDLARELRNATPGSLRYLPAPFPKNGVEVVEDYKHQILSRWSHTSADQLSAGQQVLMNGLRANTVAIDIERVQNWGIRRCSDAGNGDSYHLLRISDRASGREIARAALHESGMVEQTAFAAEKELPLAALAEVEALVEETVGAQAHSPVYVTSTGTLRCDVLMPCVAMRAKSSIFLVTPDEEMFEIPANHRVLSFKNDLGSEAKQKAKRQELESNNEVVTSLGDDQFVIAKRRGNVRKAKK